MEDRIIKFLSKNFIIKDSEDKATQEDIEKILDLGYKLPNEYLEFLKLGDEICLDKDSIIYYSVFCKSYCINGVYFLSAKPCQYSILYEFNDPPEFFPEGLLAFSETGGGDYICFDYRNVKDNPPIVIWEHEADVGKDVSYVAENFESFMMMLKSYEEAEEEYERLNSGS